MSEEEWEDLIHALRDFDHVESAVAAATRLHSTATLQDLTRLMELLKDDEVFVREAAAWPAS
jgi:hypothetical protein